MRKISEYENNQVSKANMQLIRKQLVRFLSVLNLIYQNITIKRERKNRPQLSKFEIIKFVEKDSFFVIC